MKVGKIEKYKVGLSLVSLVKYLARLRPWKWPRDETSLAVSNLGCTYVLVLTFRRNNTFTITMKL